jgi:hypothetical protein
MRRRWIFIVPAAIAGMLLFAFIGGEVVKLLWNWLLPPLFGWRPLTFWQALGMLALCRILFGGHSFGRSRSRRYTPEERERFREGIRRRCGWPRADSAGAGPSATGSNAE